MTGIFAAAAVQFPAAPEAVIALVGARYAIFHVNIRGFQIEASIGALGCCASEISDAMVAPFVGKAASIPIFAGCGSGSLKVVRFEIGKASCRAWLFLKVYFPVMRNTINKKKLP